MVPFTVFLEPFSECMLSGALASLSSYVLFRFETSFKSSPKYHWNVQIIHILFMSSSGLNIFQIYYSSLANWPHYYHSQDGPRLLLPDPCSLLVLSWLDPYTCSTGTPSILKPAIFHLSNCNPDCQRWDGTKIRGRKGNVIISHLIYFSKFTFKPTYPRIDLDGFVRSKTGEFLLEATQLAIVLFLLQCCQFFHQFYLIFCPHNHCCINVSLFHCCHEILSRVEAYHSPSLSSWSCGYSGTLSYCFGIKQ